MKIRRQRHTCNKYHVFTLRSNVLEAARAKARNFEIGRIHPVGERFRRRWGDRSSEGREGNMSVKVKGSYTSEYLRWVRRFRWTGMDGTGLDWLCIMCVSERVDIKRLELGLGL